MTTVFFGALLPGLTWNSPGPAIVSAFFVALLTGLSAALEFSDSTTSDALTLAMTLGMALFAINTGVNASTNGYGGLGFSVFWTFVGGSSSLAAALLPEIIGIRDAARTDLFKVWHGFGMSLCRWKQHWGAASRFKLQPVPTVTLSITVTEVKIEENKTEEAIAKKWLLSVLKSADRIHVGSLCFSNLYSNDDRDSRKNIGDEVDAFFLAVGRASNCFAFSLQFPWLIRNFPFLKDRVEQAVNLVDKKAASLVVLDRDREENGSNNDYSWLLSIVELIRSEIQSVAIRIMDGETWPPYSSFRSRVRELSASFPSAWPRFKDDSSWAICGYALRLAFAFTLATVPVVTRRDSWAHWFPMTVALIMAPGQGATYRKIAHRVIGTVLGLVFWCCNESSLPSCPSPYHLARTHYLRCCAPPQSELCLVYFLHHRLGVCGT